MMPCKLAGSAEFQVVFCELKSGFGGGKRLEAPENTGRITPSQNKAVGFFLAPADTASELMQLCQTEPLRAFNEHYCGVWHVHSHFNHRSGNQNMRFPFPEPAHGFLFFFRSQLAVHNTNVEFRKNFLF